MTLAEIKKSLLAAAWFMFLTFPIMVIKVNTIEKTVEWHWVRLLYVAAGGFVFSFLWRYFLRRKQGGGRTAAAVETDKPEKVPALQRLIHDRRFSLPALLIFGLFVLVFPYLFSMYQVNIMTTALIYVVTGLGLNVVVGVAGLLHLGYAAFYAVGAYTYALLNFHFGVSFWLALPIGAALGCIFAVILGFPVLRLRGDYLAIVTLGFGEITRLVLENWNDFSFGPSGIANIPRPKFLWFDFSLEQSAVFIYFLMLALALLTVFVTNRLKDSRIGRAWIAMREDEVACQAMGIDIARTKLSAFAMGSAWAGMAGVVFAAKTTFINPASFTLWESIVILCIVVLGGMGSILGVILGAMVLILLPEYLRAFSEYRMLIFGVVMVVMMVFRPGGIVSEVRRTYQFKEGLSKDGSPT
ncbi:MAG: branched-chain amino acid ABC transporter permease [Desulfobacterales bacterium]|jgi:branched-chain amino acid transport system permease protein